MKIATADLTPGEISALGFQDISQMPATVEVPDLPTGEAKLVPVVAKVNPASIPELTRDVVEASLAAQIPRVPEFDPEDITGFMVHLLGGAPFVKTYRMFGGRLTVRLQTRTAQQDEAIARTITALPQEMPAAEKLRLNLELSKTLMIKDIQLQDAVPLRPVFDLTPPLAPEPGGPPAALPLLEARKVLLGHLNQTTWTALSHCQGRFLTVYQGLLNQSDNESFWEAGSSN